VGRALLVGGAPAATGDLALLLAVHRSESTTAALPSFLRSTFCHLEYPPVSTCWRTPRFSATLARQNRRQSRPGFTVCL
jgi:hypothetical protein